MPETPLEFSLGQLLARRRRLALEEIPALLAGLPRLLDQLEDSNGVSSLVTDVVVQFAASSSRAHELIARKVVEWPAFRLKLRLAETGSNTVPRASVLGWHLPTRMAGLIYELLGGQIQTRPHGGFLYTPIAAIGEEANLTLEEMLTANAYTDCDALWRRWLRKSGVRVREHAVFGFSIPKWAIRSGRSGVLMELVPQHRRQPAIRFVAREDFRIGRSLRTADLPLKVRNSKTGEDKSHYLDDNHLIAQLSEEGIGLWDGDGETGSLNGTACGGTRLEPRRGRLLRQGSEIALAPGACDCRVRVEIFKLPETGPLRISNVDDWRSTQRAASRRRAAPLAAVVFHGAGDALPLRQVAWLFDGIGLRMTKGGVLEWAPEGSADFFCSHAYGCFWLACLKEPAERVAVDDAFLAPGQIMPLDAQNLDFGREQFTCRVLGA